MDDVTAAIESSIAGLDGSDSSDAGVVPSPVVPPAGADAGPPASDVPPSPITTAPSAVPPPAVQVQTDPATMPPKRRGPIPYERHEEMLTGIRSEHDKALSTLKAEHERVLAAERQQHQEMIRIAETDPQRFLSALMHSDPRYAEILGPVLRTHGGNGQQPAAPLPETFELPPPDSQFSDGTAGYSPAGFKAALERYGDHIEARIAKKYDGLLREHETQAEMRGAITRVTSQVQEARAWPQFQEHEKEIAAALRANPKLNLDGAYRQVVLSKLMSAAAPTLEEMRARVMAEMNAKPKGVTGTTPATGIPPSVASDDLESVIHAAIANLSR